MKTKTAFAISFVLLQCGTLSVFAKQEAKKEDLLQISGMVQPEMGSPNIGDQAPDFSLSDQKGKKTTLSSLKGHFVVIQFGASYCPFSKAELPNLQKLANDYANRNVRVLLIDVKEKESKYREYAGRLPLTFPILRDQDGKVSEKYAPSKAQPDLKDRSDVVIAGNLILDPEGKIRYFTLLDTKHFDDELVHLRPALDQMLSEGSSK